MENLTGVLGLAGGLLLNLSSLPQIAKIWKTESAGDLSIATYAMALAGMSLVTAYGFVLGDWVITTINLSGLFSLTLAICAILRARLLAGAPKQGGNNEYKFQRD
ncbi:MAG: hypothetical protein HY747_06515 [Elusimicrobia bacterium]|nr:hypothetical protein [Elusimicrobiota bacterium]